MRRRLVLAAGALCIGACLAARASGPDSGPDEMLDLPQARTYLLGLINRDREAVGLRSVEMDPTATAMGQAHADDMAAYHYLAHLDRTGRLPDQRYTELGGRDHVKENVYLSSRYAGSPPVAEYLLDAAPRFARHELDDLEAAYFNQRHPYDSHRKNIADPAHTHVGIGLSRAHFGEQAHVLANTEEFIDRYVDVDALPARVRRGERIVVSGRVLPGSSFRAIRIGRGPLPQPREPDELRRTGHYDVPSPFATYLETGLGTSPAVTVREVGQFRLATALSEDDMPGVYYVMIEVSAPDGRAVVASQRTVLQQ